LAGCARGAFSANRRASLRGTRERATTIRWATTIAQRRRHGPATLSQIANPLLQTIFIAVIGLGYYFTVRATWATVKEMRAEHAAGGGRPLITVSEDYANLPNISLIVQNVGQGPAKDISFGFSAPVESSDGFVFSELPFFREGMTSLAPGAKIGCYWDTLDNLLPLIKEGKIASDITVTVRYKDLNPLEHEWDINPRLYEGIRNVDYSGMTDLVEVLDRKIEDDAIGGDVSSRDRDGSV
jgi:hypothetical protein